MASRSNFPYKLRIPGRIQKEAENLARRMGTDIHIPDEMARFERSPDGRELQVHLKLPLGTDLESDWKWFKLTCKTDEQIRPILAREDAVIEDPLFHVEHGEGGERKFYLEPKITTDTGEKEGGGWDVPAKVAAILLSVFFISIIVHSAPGVPFSVVTSDSMVPTLEMGDLILTSPSSGGSVEKGDIILYRVPDQYQRKYDYPPRIVHRVERLSGRYIETKGDSSGPDPFKVGRKNVIGAYTGFKLPRVGFLFLFLQSTYGMLYMGILITGVALYATIPDWLGRKEEREKRVDEALRSTSRIKGALMALSNSLNEYSSSTTEYASHLKSHTAAIKQLAGTTRELKQMVKRLNESKEGK